MNGTTIPVASRMNAIRKNVSVGELADKWIHNEKLNSK